MSEHAPKPVDIEQRESIGVEAAFAANYAFDEMAVLAEKKDALIKIEMIVDEMHLDGVVIEGAVAKADLDIKEARARRNFAMFIDVAGAMIGQDSKYSGELFGSSEEAEPVELPEIDAKTLGELDTALLPEYRGEVISRYISKRLAVERKIRDGVLPAEYKLPELGTMLEKIVSLSKTYEVMYDKGWEPEVVFVPKGLKPDQWDNLLKGHSISGTDKDGSNGVYRTWDASKVVNPATNESEDLWDVAIVSASDRPILNNVSKDGKKGSNAKVVKDTFSELPTINKKSSVEEIIEQISPSEETYFAAQLAKLERGEKPLDWDTWTIGKENVKVDGSVGSVFLVFRPGASQVGSLWDRRGYYDGNFGVRPSVRGEDLALKA